MSDINEFLKLVAEGKKTDPKAVKAKELKENIKGDLSGLFSQISAVKAEDPNIQKAKKLEKQIHESVKGDLGSLFAELSSLKSKKDALVEQQPELVEEQIEEPVEFSPELVEEVINEIAPLPTPIGNVPTEVQIPDIDKYLKAVGPAPKEVDPLTKEFKTVNDKIKFLEQWIGKIQNTGPGSGEVNLRYLDDVDRSSIGIGKFLTYNPDTKKFYFATVGGDGSPQVQADWTQTDNTSADYIKNKPTLFSGDYDDLTNKPTIPAAQIQSDWNQTTDTALDYIKNKPTIPDVGHIEEVFAATSEPMGHADFTQSAISFNNSTRTFTISPVGASYDVWVKGNKFTITNTRTVTIPNTTGLYYVYFDLNGALQYKTSFFDWPNDCMTAYVYWNATTGKAPFVADERHGITLDWQTHEYLHRTRGAAIANGFDATNYVINGDGSSNTHLQIDIAGGTFFDEDLQVDVVSTNTPRPNTWDQDLTGPSRIPIFYLNGNAWVLDDPTNYPVKMGTLPKYNAYSGGTWTTPDIDNNKFGVTFIIATNNINYPVIGIIGQTQHSNIGTAEAVEFSSLNLTGFPVVEMRPLYKLVYECKNSYTNTVNARLTSVFDQRSFSSTTSAIATYTDHGALGGLADDDHPQYLLRTDADTLITTAIGNVVGAAPDALNTLKEIADQLANDESAVSSLTTAVSGKVSLTGSYANPDWITSLDYSKLTNVPTPSIIRWVTSSPSPSGAFQTMFSANDGNATITTSTGLPNLQNLKTWTFDTDGDMTFPDSSVQTTAWTGSYSYNDLTNKPTLFDGAYASLTGKPTLFSGNYTDLTNKPTLFSGAASDLTGTTLKSTVVSSSLTSVGQLTNLQVAGGASTTNNSATDHYINVGTVGQIFDDGNLHIHAKTGNVWINSLDGGDINLGLQSNSGASTVKVANDLQSKTAYKARTSWNAALNTEITLDNYRYRVTNSGGIFPQVISNIAGTTVNSSWVSVATVSGMAIMQTGSTGTLVPNNSWTSLFTSHGLDSAADMVVTTITDKGHGIVHRVTFIRNDDGSNTGYSIFAEKLW